MQKYDLSGVGSKRHDTDSMHVTETYKAREIRFLELWESYPWRVRVYGITYPGRAMPDTEMMETAKVIAFNRLSKLAPDEHHGVAFAIIHMARGADFVLLDWWTWENVLQQAIFTCPPGKPSQLTDITSSGLVGCVWELQVVNFERLAWIQHVLKKSDGRSAEVDLEDYLTQRFNGRV